MLGDTTCTAKARRAAAVHGKRNQHAAPFGVPNASPYVKDGINNTVVNGQAGAVNPEQRGTKVAAHYRLTVQPGQSEVSAAAVPSGACRCGQSVQRV